MQKIKTKQRGIEKVNQGGSSSTKVQSKFKSQKFGSKLLSMDRFGESFTMKFEGGQKELKSVTGASLSVLLILILLCYASLKMDSLIRRSQVDIISAVNEDFYGDDEVVEAK